MSTIVDLTMTYQTGMRGVSATQSMTIEKDGWNATTLSLYSHAGTHIDAPGHFIPGGDTIDTIDLSKCIGPAWVIDVTPVASREVITVERLGDMRSSISPGDRVLIRTGWSARTGTPAYRDELPRIGGDLAQWFVDRGIALLGVEPPSVADVNNIEEVTAIHQCLLGAGIVIVEGLCNLDALSSARVELIALPLSIHGCDGAPARVVAIVS